MKYLKLFESYVKDVKFFRLNHNDLLGGETEKELTPVERRIIGKDEFNEALIKSGFPDKKKCIHFMDELGFDPGFSTIYGKNKYQIEIDDKSHLGWSFYTPINDWYYLLEFKYKKLDQNILKDISENTPIDEYSDTDEDLVEQSVQRIKKLMEYNFIGNGTIEDLKRNPLFGKVPLFVWTEDKVLVKKF